MRGEARPGTHTQPSRRGLFRPIPRRHLIFLTAAIAAALLLFLLAALLLGSAGARERKRYMSQASASYRVGDYDAALSSLRKAADLETDDACLILMADCYEAQGNLDKALETLRRMNTGETAVAQRIATLEERRRQQREAGYLEVAGQKLAPDQTSLVLDGLELTDESLPAVAQFYALNSLSLMNNRITDVRSLTGLGGLDTLNLSGNQIEDISPLSQLTQLRTLYLDGNPIRDLSPLYGLSQLHTLSLCGIELSAGQLRSLAEALPDCAIRSDTPAAETQDITLGGVTFKSDVAELDLSGRDLHDISALSHCTQLKWLSLADNSLGDLTPLMNLPGLESLDISGNQVSDLRPLMGLRSLRSLQAAGNRIADTAAVGSMTELVNLDLSGNPLTELSGLRKLRNLRTLRLINAGVQDRDLPNLYSLDLLTGLWLDDNRDLSNEAMGALQSALPDCTVSYTELVYTVNLAGLSLRSDITELSLSGRELTDLTGIDKLDRLQTVDLSKNRLSNLYILQYSPSRDTILSLDLSGNELSDLSPLGCLTAVETLDLRMNDVSALSPLYKLTTLRTLYLGGNPVAEDQLELLRQALPDCEIVLD